MTSRLEQLLEASIAMAKLRKENRQLREELDALRWPKIEFELSAEEMPVFLRRQAE